MAIKVLNIHKLGELVNRVHEEVEILTKLDHPNIVKYFETYIDNKYMYLVMEYVGGGELFEMITKQNNQVLSEEMAKTYIRKILSALQHIHAMNIVHRDIKPENIMLTKDGEIKIIDFGLSKKQNKEGSMMRTIAGTPYYMAPEILSERPYTSKVDLWSVGVLLYVFMCGYMPFNSDKRFDIY